MPRRLLKYGKTQAFSFTFFSSNNKKTLPNYLSFILRQRKHTQILTKQIARRWKMMIGGDDNPGALGCSSKVAPNSKKQKAKRQFVTSCGGFKCICTCICICGCICRTNSLRNIKQQAKPATRITQKFKWTF